MGEFDCCAPLNGPRTAGGTQVPAPGRVSASPAVSAPRAHDPAGLSSARVLAGQARSMSAELGRLASSARRRGRTRFADVLDAARQALATAGEVLDAAAAEERDRLARRGPS